MVDVKMIPIQAHAPLDSCLKVLMFHEKEIETEMGRHRGTKRGTDR